MTETMNGASAAVAGAPATTASGPVSPRRYPGEYLFALGGLSLGVAALIGAGAIRVPPGSVGTIGPRAFLYLVAGVLVLASLGVLVELFRGIRGHAEEGEDIDSSVGTSWTTVGILVVLFVGHGFLIEVLGWPIAVGMLFGGAAWTLGVKKWWLSLSIGLALGIVVQLLFGTLLGLSLPAGPLLDWLEVFDG